jgi:Flp pilus assembly pilin Flp
LDIALRLATRVAAARGRQEGQGLAEYSMLLALIAMVAIAALSILGSDIMATLNFVGDNVTSAGLHR